MTGDVLVEIDPRYFRPTEVDALQGDASKARAKLGWQYRTSFEELVKEMVRADLFALKREQSFRQHLDRD
jgi:GDPmannose 4,6-dehydratase